MPLVRGSILSSKPSSASQAARIVQRFLCSDEGTDVSVKSFLTRAARSLESLSDSGHSSNTKKIDTQKTQDFENPQNPQNPNEGFAGFEDPDQATGSKIDTQITQEFENPQNPKNTRDPNEGIAGLEDPDQETGSKILDFVKHRRKREKSYLEGLTTEKNEALSEEFENPKSPKNPNEGIAGFEDPDQATGSKFLDFGKHRIKREKSYSEGLTTEKNEVGAVPSEEGLTEESRKLAKKLRKKHVVEGVKSEVDSDFCITPVERSERLGRENGTVSSSLDIEEGETEMRRKKRRKHAYEENHVHDEFVKKLDLEVTETPDSHKKRSKRARSGNEGALDEDANLFFWSSKRSEQGKLHANEFKEIDQKYHANEVKEVDQKHHTNVIIKEFDQKHHANEVKEVDQKHHTNEVKEVDQKHHSRRRVLESESEVIADGQEFPSIKKKRKDKTPK